MFSLSKVLGWEASLDMHNDPACELSVISATLPDDPVSSTSVKLWGS